MEYLPWTRPKSIYESDGPLELMNLAFGDIKIRIRPTKHFGPTTLRTRFHVMCITCDEIIHTATTGGGARIISHLKLIHSIESTYRDD